jgi:hypothetical protein
MRNLAPAITVASGLPTQIHCECSIHKSSMIEEEGKWGPGPAGRIESFLAHKKRDWLVIQSGELLKLHNIDAALPRFTLRDERLRPRQLLGDIHLRKPGVLSGSAQPLQELTVTLTIGCPLQGGQDYCEPPSDIPTWDILRDAPQGPGGLSWVRKQAPGANDENGINSSGGCSCSSRGLV